MSTSNTDQPSLIGGHVQYVKGAVEDAVGSITGSTAWSTSGAQDKEAGVEAMKAASADRDPKVDGYGRVEEIAGKVAGCEGMEKEGAQSAQSQVGEGAEGRAVSVPQEGERLV